MQDNFAHEETITKKFLSKRAMVDFVHFLDIDRVLIERSGESWILSYIATRSTVTLPENDSHEVAL